MPYQMFMPENQATIELVKALCRLTECEISAPMIKAITEFKVPVVSQIGSLNQTEFIYLPQLMIHICAYTDRNYLLSEITSKLTLGYFLDSYETTEELTEDLGFTLFGTVEFGKISRERKNNTPPSPLVSVEPTVNLDKPFAALIATVKTTYQTNVDDQPRKMLSRSVDYTLVVNTSAHDPNGVLAGILKQM
jgi:hypothetical protein